ncbi:glycosyl hydrolase family 18 (putative chitinase) [Rhodococcus sp. AG1013]|uniref:glycosyl hydrolase family 18 protein n=1 Tax=Rhodococcus sp. AG1013 TaxID=2183996 RepID=UPI000E2B989C|nr:glycosyl hydrolase family 18 protein [Rhodococcus sp. AG1013]RDI21816.1 glycosyl hydrolase family 18 (putative chitinase) [Rhodococcus sp. AG1013]
MTVALAATAALSQLHADARVVDRPQLPLVIGAIPYWDRSAALTSMRTYARYIDVASPWSYSVSADGTPTVAEGTSPDADSELGTHSGDSSIRTIPTITNTTDGRWDRETIAKVLLDPALRRAHVEALTGLVEEYGFDGVQIDYENLSAADRDSFSTFVRELGDALHRIDRVLYVAVHAKPNDTGYGPHNEAQDYAAIAAGADRVIVMAYDRHWATSTAGPIAPYDWVEEVIRYAVTRIPREKLVLGVGLYGYDWVGSAATPLTWAEVMSVAEVHRSPMHWDETSLSTHFTYVVDGITHEVWFENARSVEAKSALARRHGLASIALWRLGGEDPSIWRLGP